jgi:hypothetical protein
MGFYKLFEHVQKKRPLMKVFRERVGQSNMGRKQNKHQGDLRHVKRKESEDTCQGVSQPDCLGFRTRIERPLSRSAGCGLQVSKNDDDAFL